MGFERHEDVAVLRIEAGKANAFSAGFLDLLDGLLDELDASDARAAVLVGYDRFFSAGLALPELAPLDRDGMRAFMRRFSEVILRVFALDRPVVAAINGHAIAGGCVLAVQADRRLMADGPFKIGLSEVRLGIALPSAVLETLRLVVGAPALFPIAQEGLLFAPSEALGIGLVDEVVAPEALEARAIERARELGALPALAYASVKQDLRRPARERIAALGDGADERWLDTWFSDEGQAGIAAAVERLAKR